MIARFKWLFFSIITFVGCESEGLLPKIISIEFKTPLEGLPNKGRIRFDNPEVGQRNFYLKFEATKGTGTSGPQFNYKNDTLVYAITGKVGDKWILKEFMTVGSVSNAILTDIDTAVVTHFMQIDTDSIHFTMPAGGFIRFSPVGSDLSLPFVVSDEIENKDCLPIFEYRSSIWSAYTLNHTQFGEHFDYLLNYFDYTDMSGDGYGYTFVYANQTGLTRMAWISAWDIWDADGWDLLPE